MSSENKIKLFLVDDDAVFLKLLEFELLEQDNFEIETYATGERCIAHLSHKPDAIILDYHLDGIDKNAMTGIETLDKIKAFNPDIPVVMLSSQDEIEEAINCMSHKAFDYVVKSDMATIRLKKMISTIFITQKLNRLKTEA